MSVTLSNIHLHHVSRKDFDRFAWPEERRSPRWHGKPYWEKEVELDGFSLTLFCDEPPASEPSNLDIPQAAETVAAP